METEIAGAEPESGVTDASPASTDVKEAASSPVKDVKLNPLAEAMDKAFAKLEAESKDEKPEDKETPKETSPKEKTESGEVETEVASDKDKPADDKAKTKDSEDVHLNPFSKRPEWVEATKLLGEEAAKKVRPVLRNLLQRADKLAEQMKPMAEVINQMRRHTGDEVGFKKALTLIETYATDPAEAIPILENLLLDAKERSGFEISADDLKARIAKIDQRVKEGHLSEEDAAEIRKDLVEVSKTRAKLKQEQEKQSRSAADTEQEKENEAYQAKLQALNRWEMNGPGKDASFGSVTDANDPKHGESVADQVFDAVTNYMARNPDSNPSQLVAEAERMYKIARGRLKSSGPQKSQRAVTGAGSSVKAVQLRKGATLSDVIQAKLDEQAAAA